MPDRMLAAETALWAARNAVEAASETVHHPDPARLGQAACAAATAAYAAWRSAVEAINAARAASERSRATVVSDRMWANLLTEGELTLNAVCGATSTLADDPPRRRRGRPPRAVPAQEEGERE